VDLQTTQQTMHRLLRGQLSENKAAKILQAPVERLAAYARFAESHITDTLAKVFVQLRAELPANIWKNLSHNFYLTYPPAHYELNACVESFVNFLQTHPEITTAQQERAIIDWHEWQVYSDPADLTQSTGINPTLKILKLEGSKQPELEARAPQDRPERSAGRVRGAEQRRANNLPKRKPEPEPKPILYLLWRDLKHQVHTTQANDALLFAIKVTCEKIPLAQAATQAHISIESAQQFIHDAYKLEILI
jgi:hypothetical protein